jgi:methyl-accepting chemotaxis protein
VNAIRQAAQESANRVSSIVTVLSTLEANAATISTEVERQGHVAANIASSVEHASGRVEHVVHSLHSIKELAAETTQAAGFLDMAAHEIAEQAAAIQNELQVFSTALAS